MNQQASAVDIGDLKMGAFPKAQTAGVDGGEADPVAQESDTAENPVHLLTAEDDRQLFLAWGANKGEGRPLSGERMLEEKLDPAQGDGARAAGVLLDMLEVEEILSELFLGDQGRGFVIVLRQLAHGSDVHLLSPFRQAPELETFDHSLSQCCHGYTS
jgi:hypothetical protein